MFVSIFPNFLSTNIMCRHIYIDKEWDCIKINVKIIGLMHISEKWSFNNAGRLHRTTLKSILRCKNGCPWVTLKPLIHNIYRGISMEFISLWGCHTDPFMATLKKYHCFPQVCLQKKQTIYQSMMYIYIKIIFSTFQIIMHF